MTLHMTFKLLAKGQWWRSPQDNHHRSGQGYGGCSSPGISNDTTLLLPLSEKIDHICISNPHFMYEFHSCIYDAISTYGFEENMKLLKMNKWLKRLYECCRNWALIFLKDTLFACTKTTLSELILKYIVALEIRFDAENQANLKSLDAEAYLKTCSLFEKQKFQQELIEVAASHSQWICKDESNLTLRVNSFEREKKWIALVDALNSRDTYIDMPY
ncbi:hypothetical protein Taro_009541 [Colocasia esculenta]|uniref:Protein FAR1-RELATED SEQUENCE n=1 Tax=Colocasia esculenta TaxID=4460 RepID=A0A843U559_COLES|nr:hypothetical protein [Colocasia esculenta]